jgi:predicted dehydrogenase
MRTAVIGVGLAGSSHLLDLTSSNEFDVVAVCASRIQRAEGAARLFGIPAACRDINDMLSAHRPEAVVIATPPQVTPRIISRCLAAGAWVIVDKPAGPDAPSLREVINAVGPLSYRARVAYNRRYQEHVSYARGVMTRGDLGPVVEVNCEWTGRFARRYMSRDTYRNNAGFGDGVVLDTVCHIVDTLAILGLCSFTIRNSWLTVLPTGPDVGAEIRLTCGRQNIPISVSIRENDAGDNWRITIYGKFGFLEIDNGGLRGQYQGHSVIKTAADARRPVDDLLCLRTGDRAYGATLHQAVETLDAIDEIRAIAIARRQWQRPRAKALGRLNGAC